MLLSSHVLAQVEALCDRVTIIRLGRTVESGSLAELRHITRTAIAVETARPVTGLDTVEGVHNLRVEGAGTRVSFDVDTARIDPILKHLGSFGVVTLRSSPPTLEELFLRHYGDELALEPERADLDR